MAVNTQLFLNVIILSLSLIGLVISTAVLVVVYLRIHPLLTNIAILLTCNTYITLILGSLLMVFIYSYSINDDPNSFNAYLCPLRAYFIHVFICSFYYSCILQAMFRLFRVVYYTRKQFQSLRFFFLGTSLQWLISFLYILIHLLTNDFQYSTFANSCWISFKNIRALFQALVIMYIGPISSVCLMYAYILRFTRRTVQIQQRQNQNRRDLLVLKRIVILVLVAMGIGIATVFALLIYVITGYLIPIAYHLQGLSISGGFFMGSIGFAFITPQIHDIFKRKRRSLETSINIIVMPRAST